MADEKEVWRFDPYGDDDVFIDDDGDIVCGEEGCSTFRLIAQCVSPDDAERIIKAVNVSRDAQWCAERASAFMRDMGWQDWDDNVPVELAKLIFEVANP